MLIPITFNPTPNRYQETPKLPSTLAKISNDEVILIELQGNLEGPQSLDKNGQLVGELTIDETGSRKPILTIGHHLLEGSIAQLTKPLAVLHRSGTDVNSIDEASKDSDQASQGSGRQISWESMGIVKRKIVFAKRPMPIVGRQS